MKRFSAVFLALMVAMVTGAATPSLASESYTDSFTAGNNAPVVSVDADGSIEPNEGKSSEAYTVTVAVADANSLEDIASVVVCLYHVVTGNPSCGAPDPQHTVQLSWTPVSGFGIASGSNKGYWALGQNANGSGVPQDLTDASGDFVFSFHVSEAMREGAWEAKATATDVAGTDDDDTAEIEVEHYSHIADRGQIDFGTVVTNGSQDRTHAPIVTSNGPTVLLLTGDEFTAASSHKFALRDDLGPPSGGEVALDCHLGVEFAEVSAVRLSLAAEVISGSPQTLAGTEEDGYPIDSVCRLSSGGQRPPGTYTSTVVNGIEAAPEQG